MKRIYELGANFTPEEINFIISLYEEWLLKTKEGKERIVDLFKFDWKTGESDTEYKIADTNICIPGDQVYLLNAVVVKGEFVPPAYVDEYQIVTERCKSCGTHVHCLNSEDVCNHCSLFEESQVKGDFKRCEVCTVARCPNHPMKVVF